MDRSAAYTLRQAAYVIGEAEPIALAVDTYGAARVPDAEILARLQKNFDLTPGGMITRLDLRRPIYLTTAAYGHFGRPSDGVHFPWETVVPL